ncbi:MAG: T9SS type A sorting domain-containing protein [Bacteroidia bacterium]|nr:T9SS type A sorting domain-containing protein [Bacteroidia bacterium]
MRFTSKRFLAASLIAILATSFTHIKAQVAPSGYTTTPCSRQVNLATLPDDPWKITITHGDREINQLDEATIKFKEEVTRQKIAALGDKFKVNATNQINGIDTPEIRNNFAGISSNAVPFDNGTAVSNGRYVVHSVNSSISIRDTSGTPLKSYPLTTFFGVSNTISDPRVIYDSYNDRFIVVAIPTNVCAVFIAFSNSNDPTGTWNVYNQTIPGEVSTSIYDYPYVGVTEYELIISGSVFPSGGGSVHPNILQMAKAEGYNAKPLRMRNYKLGATNNYSLCVVNHAGPEFTYGTKAYLLSSTRSTSSSNRFYLYTISDTVGGNPQLTQSTIIGSVNYLPPGNAPQYSSSWTLQTNDCRVLSAVYSNGVIHAVQHGDANNNGYAAILYHRVNVSAVSVSTFKYTKTQTDLCYPSVALFCAPNNQTDQSVLIGFQEVSSIKYPGLSAIVCKNDGSWSNPIPIRNGTASIIYGRWGDYTSCTRKHNAAIPTGWISGEYGASGVGRSCWVAEVSFTPPPPVDTTSNPIGVKNPFALYPNPVEGRFKIEFNLPVEQFIRIAIYDMLGQEVKLLLDEPLPSGKNILAFDKTALAAGMYVVRISDPQKILSEQKLIVR